MTDDDQDMMEQNGRDASVLLGVWAVIVAALFLASFIAA